MMWWGTKQARRRVFSGTSPTSRGVLLYVFCVGMYLHTIGQKGSRGKMEGWLEWLAAGNVSAEIPDMAPEDPLLRRVVVYGIRYFTNPWGWLSIASLCFSLVYRLPRTSH
ncbi:hypothetical protein BU24DRAFT_251427 [Aaosphaeria arxii CBS 175.79]|uniref:Uncharacterized protein n=1 Tax=Aaosphaeria arxii CBS 175.79 TaxID=1450172 RepID=A0A6A5XNV2_9PLEO|nr:uncharacterized protein BU24DRAFT_251427 [Aaosphaeria arxii CBS 175.79]KAF2014034.1 hypothetical protein BU24DRAFT_251427 [Aaosphaeria arxii CBS 175.79]